MSLLGFITNRYVLLIQQATVHFLFYSHVFLEYGDTQQKF